MFFVLSKILNYLVMPMVIVVSLLAIGLILKKQPRKKRFLTAGIVLLLLFSNDFIANEIMRAWEIPVTPFAEITKTYDYGVLLSGTARTDLGPSDRVYVFTSADRINHTVQLYKMGIIRKVLISGGSGQLIESESREADALNSLMQIMGVPAEDIIVENQSRNTHESAVLVAQLVKEKGLSQNGLLITSAFHMRRSRACFKNEGLQFDTFSADVRSHYRHFTPDGLLIPKVEAIGMWQTLMKEWTGMTAYWLAGYI